MVIEKSCGAVVFTVIGGARHYLLVDSVRETNCGFPKGHMENGEAETDTALREILEETGVKAEIIPGFRRQIEYVMPNGITKQAVYFIARYSGQTAQKQEAEPFEVLLLPYDEAFDALTFDNTKSVLKSAHAWLDSI